MHCILFFFVILDNMILSHEKSRTEDLKSLRPTCITHSRLIVRCTEHQEHSLYSVLAAVQAEQDVTRAEDGAAG